MALDRMDIFVFTLYLVFFSFIVTRIKFFTASGIDKKILVALFLFKITTAIAYGLFYGLPQYEGRADTWEFFKMSKPETEFLLKDPWGFVKDLFSYGYETSGNLFTGLHSYWNNLKTNAFTKLVAVCNVFTGTNYWTDIILLDFLYFFGPVAIFRVMQKNVKANQIILIAAVFCLPSFIFWYSGLHKDGLIFMVFAMTVFHFNKMMEEKKVIISSLIIMLLCLAVVFAFRNYVVLLLLPALLVWWLCEKYPSKKILITALVYVACIAVFFIAPMVSPALDFPGYVTGKQNEFRALVSNTQIVLPELDPDFAGFARFLPYAIDIAILRPHINEIGNPAYWPSIAENIFLWGCILVAVYRQWGFHSQKKVSSPVSGFIIFCYCFSFSLLLLSGYTVTLTAAIIRYRSFIFPFIFAPLAGVLFNRPK